MIFGNAMSHDGEPVIFGWIAFVFEPIVLRKFIVDPLHVLITIGLRQDRSRSDRQIFSVTFDEALMVYFSVLGKPVTVYQQEPRSDW